MTTPRRTTVLFAAAIAAVVLATPGALAQSLSEEKASVDNRISALRSQISGAKHEEGVLSSQIAGTTNEIASLEGEIGVISAKLATLESELARHRARLAALQERYKTQTRHLRRLQADHARAQRTLEKRLVELYKTDQADAMEIMLQVKSLSELIDQLDFVNEIGLQDRRIAAKLKRLKAEMKEARRKTGLLRDEVAEATAVLAAKTEETRSARAELVGRQQALAAARAEKQSLLASVRDDRHSHEEDLSQLLTASAQLSARIQAAQEAAAAQAAAEAEAAAAAAAAATASSGGSSSGGATSASGGGYSGGGSSASSSGGGGTSVSSSGLAWPVSGTVTSGFGPRWGRMHQGIDISAPTGTAVRAAAAGRVIMAGWNGGYGNAVVIDHGGGLSTLYAHLSAIWVRGGSVGQGQTIGAVGCTGSCTGAHLHFEVRVNGRAVNPLSYL